MLVMTLATLWIVFVSHSTATLRRRGAETEKFVVAVLRAAPSRNPKTKRCDKLSRQVF
jgi:hypothetical protein